MHNKISFKPRSSLLLRNKKGEGKGGGHPLFLYTVHVTLTPCIETDGRPWLETTMKLVPHQTTSRNSSVTHRRPSNWFTASTHVLCGRNHVIRVPHNTKSTCWYRLDERSHEYQHLAGYAKQGKMWVKLASSKQENFKNFTIRLLYRDGVHLITVP